MHIGLLVATMLALPNAVLAAPFPPPAVHREAKGDIIIDSIMNGADFGLFPYANLTPGPKGTLFTTAADGCIANIFGCVIELAPEGSWYNINLVYAFQSSGDGYQPVDAPQLRSDGSLVLTTLSGGPAFTGTISILTPHASFYSNTVVYAFKYGTDGGYPLADLASDHHGGYVGVTNQAGDPSCGCGVVYRIVPSGSTFTFGVIHAFVGGTDGSLPEYSSTPMVDKHGTVFGTTPYGGANGDGVVYSLTPGKSGQYTEKILYAFSGPDGSSPNTSLVEDASGNLFGTTTTGGANGIGTIFELSPAGSSYTETVLHSFSGPEGSGPDAGLVSDPHGNLYGTAVQGGNPACNASGSMGCGVAYEFDPTTRKVHVLHAFVGGYDGQFPDTTLLLSKAGIFGTTQRGGFGGAGTAYELPR